MKKVKNFTLLLITFVTLFMTSSCDKEGSLLSNLPTKNDVSSIIGTWVAFPENGDYLHTMTLNADGTCVEIIKEEGSTDTFYGTYTFDGETISVKFTDGSNYSYRAEISGKTATFYNTKNGEKVGVWRKK